MYELTGEYFLSACYLFGWIMEFYMRKWRISIVTVHSVLSNTLRDAQNLCYSHKFARYVSGFWHSHAKTPRGIVACEQ